MNTPGKLAGKRALITGAGTGIGREIALEFAREVADVVLHYAHARAAPSRQPEEIRAMGRRVAVFQANFDDVDAVALPGPPRDRVPGRRRLPGQQRRHHAEQAVPKVTREQFDSLYHVNIRAQFFLTQRSPRTCSDGGGAVCNITSIHGLQAAPEHSVYAGTKGAIVAYTRTLAVELAHRGIRVNAIAPAGSRWRTTTRRFPALGKRPPRAAEERRPRGPRRDSAGYRPAGRLPLFRRRRVHRRADPGGRRRHDVADVAVHQFPRRSQNRFGTGYVPGV